MSNRPNAGIRCPGHDYRARCIYHIVLNKADGIEAFSKIAGSPNDSSTPPCTVLTETGKTVDRALYGLKQVSPHIGS